MAPFLVITLLLALGAGIVAWCVTGPAYQGPPLTATRKRRADHGRAVPNAVAPEAEPLISAVEPTPVVPAAAQREAQP